MIANKLNTDYVVVPTLYKEISRMVAGEIVMAPIFTLNTRPILNLLPFAVYITMKKHIPFCDKNHNKWPCSIAMFNYQRVVVTLMKLCLLFLGGVIYSELKQ